MAKRVTIVGAGPAGNWAAYQLAKAGFRVSVFEEHETIGEPFQCTGILTSQLYSFLDIKPVLVNTSQVARIICGSNYVDVSMKRDNVIIHREEFDRHLAKKAQDAGAMFYTKHRVQSNTKTTTRVKDIAQQNIKSVKHDYLIGADGPTSMIAKNNGMWCDRKFWFGVQARAYLPNDNKIEFFTNIGTFSWIVPENSDVVRIGLLAHRQGKAIFDLMCKNRGVTKFISYQGGLVPIYNPNVVTQKGNIYLIGDAALQVKATTGGGIIQSMIAAKACADAIINNRSYEKEWRKSMGLDLWLHLKMRQVMDKFTDANWNMLIDIFKSDKNKQLLECHDRDHPKKFFFKLLLQEPRLWRFAKFLI
ncbi:MAG: NAD(P)/FAD-dependent oxidoreductase [Nanoarchaeota archaeon]